VHFLEIRCDLKTILYRKKIRQKKLAEILEVSEQTVSYWVNDKVLPDLKMALLISDVLKVPVNEIWVLIKENTMQ
jgi:DNA-binding XRE family transcriptional regulator